jgi:alanine racemase
VNKEYSLKEIAQAAGGTLSLNVPDPPFFSYLLTDSRRIVSPALSLFFALKGDRYDGHQFIPGLFNNGVRSFVVSRMDPAFRDLKANFILVSDVLRALQDIAVFHRSKFNFPVIGVTGSNGKTIVKEWIYQLLRDDKNIVRSPKSYNSQIGVPLSVWQMNSEHELGVFEGGLSKPGEMENVERVMLPSIGIFTNIGHAHDENFTGLEQKVAEKMKLFARTGMLIYCKDYSFIHEEAQRLQGRRSDVKFFTWSRKGKADLQVARVTKGEGETSVQGIIGNDFREIKIPFTDEASVENAIHCWALMICLGYEHETIAKRMLQLSPVAMRLEMKQGINNCSVINDSYNSDIGSLTIALDFLNQQKQHDRKTLILSDILQSGKNDQALYAEVARLLKDKKVTRLIGIGEALTGQAGQFEIPEKIFFSSTEEFLKNFHPSLFRDEVVLVKGARTFGFERISQLLQQKGHETVLEVNLNALVNNLNYYRSRLKPGTKIMAMVKAFSYGSGSFEIASVLQFHHVDYLTVAYADEGVELRKGGITLPIMVMNPE